MEPVGGVHKSIRQLFPPLLFLSFSFLGMEPVGGYTKALARAVRKVVHEHLARLESRLPQAVQAQGAHVLVTVLALQSLNRALIEP